MSKVKKEILDDFNYVSEIVDGYLVDYNALTLEVYPAMIKGEMSADEFVIWAIGDILNAVFEGSDYMNEKERKFFEERLLEDRENILNIINKYDKLTEDFTKYFEVQDEDYDD